MCNWIVLSASGGTPDDSMPHIKVRPLSSINQGWNLPIFTRVKITRVKITRVTRVTRVEITRVTRAKSSLKLPIHIHPYFFGSIIF